MNVFVLSTGRSGSETFARACRCISNYSVEHESRRAARVEQGLLAYSSLEYPTNHIEVDNRLSWFLGTLDKVYGDSAFYVHLIRDQQEVARSLLQRGINSILFSYAWGPLQYYSRTHALPDELKYQVGLQYWQMVNDNIELFLRDKTQKLTIWLPDMQQTYPRFWEAIGAQGDLEVAMAEWDTHHNATKTSQQSWCFDVEHYYKTHKSNQEITGIVPHGSKLILVADYAVDSALSLGNRILMTIDKRDGDYWRPPADDKSAIAELNRLRQLGAEFIVFLWPSFWWLEYYKGLEQYLRTKHNCVLRSSHTVIYDLRAAPD